MKTRLTHVRANVSNLQKSIEWYEKVLNFKADTPYPAKKPTYVSFESEEGAVFSIMVDKKPSWGRYNFSVADVDGLWESLKDIVEIIEPLFDTPYGTKKNLL